MSRRVVLGISGSIAAYKAIEIVRLLRKSGVEVRVILTKAGAEFVTPLTLATLSEQPVTVELFGNAVGPTAGWEMPDAAEPVRSQAQSRSDSAAAAGGEQAAAPSSIEHIRASRESDLILVAPATANIMAKVAHGIADDALSATILASSVPTLFAPAMNTRMWDHPATRDNRKLLERRGALFVQPETGDLACGEFGTGRMAEPRIIAGAVLRYLNARSPRGRVLVTAGGTEEALDPVRCLTNHSSGKMGFAVAERARDLGYEVTLIAARTSAEPPTGVELVRVGSALEMANAVQHLHAAHDILVMAAAVADYRPRRATAHKLPSGEGSLRLDLAPNPDILASIRGQRDHLVTIGFALETDPGAAVRAAGAKARGEAKTKAAPRGGRAPLERATAKLTKKGCDLIVLNDPTQPGAEFGGDTNQVTLLSAAGDIEELPLLSKSDVARRLLEQAESIRARKQGRVRAAAPAAPRSNGSQPSARGRRGR